MLGCNVEVHICVSENWCQHPRVLPVLSALDGPDRPHPGQTQNVGWLRGGDLRTSADGNGLTLVEGADGNGLTLVDDLVMDSFTVGARYSSVVRVSAHGAMGHWIDPSWWTH